jgi:hypothetical protein
MMTADNGAVRCNFCEKGHLTWRLEEMAFRQSSDKGDVHCRVALSVGTCGNCGSKTVEPGADRIFDAAFQREYDKLP